MKRSEYMDRSMDGRTTDKALTQAETRVLAAVARAKKTGSNLRRERSASGLSIESWNAALGHLVVTGLVQYSELVKLGA